MFGLVVRENRRKALRVHPTIAIGPYLGNVGDPLLVASFVSIVESIGEAFGQLDSLNLELFELDPELDHELDIWTEVKPLVTELFASAQHVAAETRRCFPPAVAISTDLVDLELDLALDDFDAEMPSPVRDSHELRLDELLQLVEPGVPLSIESILCECSQLLETVVLEHLGRLDSSMLRSNNHVLLSELHELKGRAEVALDTMVAIIVRGLTETPLIQAFPPYVPAPERAARLRRWSVDLKIALHQILTKTKEQEDTIKHATELAHYATQYIEFSWLRSADRAHVQRFRRWLKVAPSQAKPEPQKQLKEILEWAKSMNRINQREQLLTYDRRAVALAQSLVQQSVRGAPLMESLQALFGRSPELDRAIIEARAGRPLRRKQLVDILTNIDAELEQYAHPSPDTLMSLLRE